MGLRTLTRQEVTGIFSTQAGYTNKCIENGNTAGLTLDDLFAACACCQHSGACVYTEDGKELLHAELDRTESDISDYCLGCKVENIRRNIKDNEAEREEKETDKEEERIVSLEETQEFYEWLQGKNQPDGFTFRAAPKLTSEQAFSVIYYLQEKLQIIPDIYERCDGCGELYDSDYEGTSIDKYSTIITEEGEEVLANFPEEMYGWYCDNCRPDDIEEPYGSHDAKKEED